MVTSFVPLLNIGIHIFFASSDVRYGWPHDYHNTFWENYYRKYGMEYYDHDFSIQMPR